MYSGLYVLTRSNTTLSREIFAITELNQCRVATIQLSFAVSNTWKSNWLLTSQSTNLLLQETKYFSFAA